MSRLISPIFILPWDLDSSKGIFWKSIEDSGSNPIAARAFWVRALCKTSPLFVGLWLVISFQQVFGRIWDLDSSKGIFWKLIEDPGSNPIAARAFWVRALCNFIDLWLVISFQPVSASLWSNLGFGQFKRYFLKVNWGSWVQSYSSQSILSTGI